MAWHRTPGGAAWLTRLATTLAPKTPRPRDDALTRLACVLNKSCGNPYNAVFFEIRRALRINNPIRRLLRVRRQSSRRASQPARSARVRDRNNVREASNETCPLSAAAFALAAAVNLSPALAQGQTAFPHQGSQPFDDPFLGCRRVSGALRIPVRLRQALGLARSLDFRPVGGTRHKRWISAHSQPTNARPLVLTSNGPVEVPLDHHGQPENPEV